MTSLINNSLKENTSNSVCEEHLTECDECNSVNHSLKFVRNVYTNLTNHSVLIKNLSFYKVINKTYSNVSWKQYRTIVFSVYYQYHNIIYQMIIHAVVDSRQIFPEKV